MDLSRHRFADIHLTWTGNRGSGTSGYRAYGRDHELSAPGKPVLAGSAARSFHGDRDRWNPEELLIAALAQCHMLTFFHLATQAGIIVTAYEDEPTGVLHMDGDGIGGSFESVTLHPRVTVADGTDAPVDTAQILHAQVPDYCFIARSMNFPVRHEPTTEVAEGPA